MKLADTKENRITIELLSNIKKTEWNGNTIHGTLKDCLVALNLQSGNSGWYNPKALRIAKLNGIYMINEDGSLLIDGRIIKEDEKKFRIEYLSISAYNEFEQKYSERIK